MKWTIAILVLVSCSIINQNFQMLEISHRLHGKRCSSASFDKRPDAEEINIRQSKRLRTLRDFRRISEMAVENHPERIVFRNMSIRETQSSDFHHGLVLHGVEELSTNEARALSRYLGNNIYFPDMHTLSPSVARTLVKWEGLQRRALHFCGLQQAGDNAFVVFQRWEGDRISVGLRNPSTTILRHLASVDVRGLYLNGLGELSVEHARIVASFEGAEVTLDSVRSLSLDALRTLLRWGGNSLAVGLLQLDHSSARLLSQWNGIAIDLPQLETIPFESAEALKSWNGRSLRLGVERLSPESARSIAEWEGGTLRFPNLELTDLTASNLVSWRGDMLGLDGVSVLSQEIADALQTWTGHRLSLNGLSSLDESTATRLTRFRVRDLSLLGLESISEKVADILIQFPGSILHRSGQIDDELRAARRRARGLE